MDFNRDNYKMIETFEICQRMLKEFFLIKKVADGEVLRQMNTE